LALNEPRISSDLVAFLGGAYELKTAADYGADAPVSLVTAVLAVGKAAEMLDIIAALLTDSS
jgi:hypothetical protein